MHMTVERDDFVAALSKVAKAANPRATSVLAGIQMMVPADDTSQVRLRATDQDLTLTTTVEVSDAVAGEIVLPAKTIVDAIRTLPSGAVTLTVTDPSTVEVAADRSTFGVRQLPAAEFPQVAEPDDVSVKIGASDLAAILPQVIPFASGDAARPILNGVFFDASGDMLAVAATDSYRLGVANTDVPVTGFGEGSVNIPAPALEMVAKYMDATGDVEISMSPRAVLFRAGNYSVQSVLIAGDYPRYQGLLPTSFTSELLVVSDDLASALNRVQLMADDRKRAVLNLSPDKITLTATGITGDVSVDIDGDYSGDEFDVQVNATYLAEAVAATGADKVRLSFNSNQKPILVRSSDSDTFTALVMPVR